MEIDFLFLFFSLDFLQWDLLWATLERSLSLETHHLFHHESDFMISSILTNHKLQFYGFDLFAILIIINYCLIVWYGF